MAFTSASATPFGLRPVRYKNGTPWNGGGNWYYVPSTDGTRIGKYEPVATTGTAHATWGTKQVTRYTAGSLLLGSAIGFLPAGAFMPQGTPSSLADPTSKDIYHYRPASVGMWVLVADDPNIIFEAQGDAVIAAASIGLNCDLITAADCSTTTGLSVAAIDSSEVGATGQLKVLGLTQMIAGGTNLIGGTYPMYDVTINEHELAQGAGAAGV